MCNKNYAFKFCSCVVLDGGQVLCFRSNRGVQGVSIKGVGSNNFYHPYALGWEDIYFNFTYN